MRSPLPSPSSARKVASFTSGSRPSSSGWPTNSTGTPAERNRDSSKGNTTARRSTQRLIAAARSGCQAHTWGAM